MFRNYLTVAVRNLVRHKIYSFINIFGLAIGMACFFLIFSFVRFELSYDRYHEHTDRIYRVLRQCRYEPGDPVRNRANTGAPMAPLLRSEFPGIEHAIRFGRFGGVVRWGERRFVESRFFFADKGVFEVFAFPFLQGNPETALKEPFSVVLTEETANKYFGDEDPLGQMLTYKKHDFKITGIVKIPPNSHFHFDFLTSFESLRTFIGRRFFSKHWDGPVWTYIKLREGYPPAELERLLPAFVDKYVDKQLYYWVGSTLQPLTSIYLQSDVDGEIGESRDPASLYVLSVLAAVILLIACINFMNLSTVRSATRAQEVGMRKVLGGHRLQLVRQFLGESIFLSGIALIFALALVELLLPTFNRLVGKELNMNYGEDPLLLLIMVGVAVIVGILAGSYPAFFLSAFHPILVLKGWGSKGGSGRGFRRGLVVFQFVLSVVLIIGTIIINQQYQFLTHKELGFDKKNVIVVPLEFISEQEYELYKHELLRNPRILSVTASSQKPGVSGVGLLSIRPAGSDHEETINTIYVDFDYLETLHIELVEGRDFARNILSDVKSAFLLNALALEKLGGAFSPGNQVELFVRQNDKIIPMHDGTVIGVVRDFNYWSLYLSPKPVVFAIDPRCFDDALIRIRPDQMLDTIGFIKAQWNRLFPETPFDFSFLDEDIERVYRPVQRWQTIFGYFTMLAIFVAGLGLFGLASFTTERRTKEIGIRKVLGASVSNIVLLLSKDFIQLVIVSNLIAWPIAYWAMNRWLQDFAYRINIGWWTFVLAGALALLIALLTVSFQAIKAALANPVEALRYE